jgi:indolepyruvate ferredoxin oxidoreductase
MSVQGPPVELGDKYTHEEGSVFLTGVQALVRLPLDQNRLDLRRGLKTAALVTGYPGSPLGGYDLELARHKKLLAEHDVVHQMAVNEELAATAIMGTQVVNTLPNPRVGGVTGLWYGKAPGLDRAGDAMRHANYAGVHPNGGVVALVGDDPTCKSSTVPCASEGTLAALLMPVLYPGDVQEMLDLGLHAIALSRSCGLWVGFKVAVNVADSWGTIEVGPDRVDPVRAQAQLDGRPYIHEPTLKMFGDTLHRLEHSLAYGRLQAALLYARANGLNRIVQKTPDDRLGIIAPGKTFYDLRQSLRDLGLGTEDVQRLGIRMLHLRMMYPLDGEIIREFAAGLDEVIVLEDKQPFIERMVKEELFNLKQRPFVFGKRDEEGQELTPLDGELGADSIALAIGPRILRLEDIASIREHLDRLRSIPTPAPLQLARSPYFCSGCPHNTSTKVPDEAVVGAGIGCHVMTLLMREKEVGTTTGLTQMGGEGAQWIGQSPFTGLGHIFQNVGDGTFHHSASLAVRASVAAGTNITYKLLWNSYAAMTGAQPPIGAMSIENVTRWLLAEGVKRIIMTTEDISRWEGADLPPEVDVVSRDRIIQAQATLAGIPGVSVLIHDQECAAEQRRKYKSGKLEEPPTRIFINERVCEGCGDCGEKSNCLSVQPVETEFGRKTQIHQPSCNKDYSCVKGDCPSFLTVVPGEQRRKGGPEIEPLGADVFPVPSRRDDAATEFGLRLTGIGGTGVVTVAQTIATAATLDGRFVRGLDQTGLAQKGGPVVSDLKFTAEPLEQSNKLSAVDCDLYLVADILTGATQKNLIAADPDRTVAIVSTASVPTGMMVVDVRAWYPETEGLVQRIFERCRSDASVALDAQHVSERLFGTNLPANVLLIGAAYQTGALPISAESLEKAIELNGRGAKVNIQAFRRGRQLVADAAALRQTLDSLVAPAPQPTPTSPKIAGIAAQVRASSGSKLERMVRIRVPELDAYQDRRYAARYADWVERVRTVESERVPGHSELAEAVSFSLHKLMSYKDEYEVARLHLDPQLKKDIETKFGAGAKFAWNLHPPMLRALGWDRKIKMDERFEPVFKALVRMKRLRGTRLDPFGQAHVRKVERALIREFEGILEEIMSKLSERNHAVAVEMARLPDMVRGYEEIKLEGVKRYRARMAQLRPGLDADPEQVLEVVLSAPVGSSA